MYNVFHTIKSLMPIDEFVNWIQFNENLTSFIRQKKKLLTV